MEKCELDWCPKQFYELMKLYIYHPFGFQTLITHWTTAGENETKKKSWTNCEFGSLLHFLSLYVCGGERGGYDFEVFWSSFYATVAYICYLPIRTWEQAFLVFVVSWFWPKFHLHSFSFNAFSWHWSFKVNQWQGGKGGMKGERFGINYNF